MILSSATRKLTIGLLIFGLSMIACDQKKVQKDVLSEGEKRHRDYIRKIPGKDEHVPEEVVAKGEVLIAYAGCYDCHRIDKKSKGPAFIDIAKRYPIQPAYRDLLARKIISGGYGSWGNPVMVPHPHISMENAQTMAYFILSLEQED
ncbi:c-type cytochrome [Cyclobacterium marinum]|uniref:Cytochrome c domain-containing protein n=1 Tax=Cyclobacterium marinum (strain ATCC 25205 / DSM 745 / LMG 13164 / NCIMB 1802) TaxID=880070 RepID=G0J1U7_CYCMS|nr:c-type cytochrome [Cyclobacterium marinum]AEL23953.1 hypothetical protein Cycma_0170 [Cyclobacterium marinum DSM 745]